MASDQKLTELTAAATVALTDELYVVIDPSGTPLDRSVTPSVLVATMRPEWTAFVSTANGAAQNTASETSIVGTGVGSVTLAANYLTVGKVLHVRAMGVLSNTGTPTLTLKVKFGTTVLATTGAVTTVSGLSNNLFVVDVWLTCRATGASGAVWAQGVAILKDLTVGMPNTGGSTIDTTVTQAVGVTAQWGAGDPANSITCTHVFIERVN